MQRAWSVAAALALLATARARADEPWQGRPLSAAERDACRTLPHALVRPVGPAHLAEATALLETAPAVALDDARAAEWIGIATPRAAKPGALSEQLMRDAIGALEDRYTAATSGEHAPRWGPTDQWMLGLLVQASSTPHPPLEPVLVRAVEGAETDGSFDAAACGDALAVRRVAYDAGRPELIRAPVIVFIARPPATVQAWREVTGRDVARR